MDDFDKVIVFFEYCFCGFKVIEIDGVVFYVVFGDGFDFVKDFFIGVVEVVC